MRSPARTAALLCFFAFFGARRFPACANAGLASDGQGDAAPVEGAPADWETPADVLSSRIESLLQTEILDPELGRDKATVLVRLKRADSGPNRDAIAAYAPAAAAPIEPNAFPEGSQHGSAAAAPLRLRATVIHDRGLPQATIERLRMRMREEVARHRGLAEGIVFQAVELEPKIPKLPSTARPRVARFWAIVAGGMGLLALWPRRLNRAHGKVFPREMLEAAASFSGVNQETPGSIVDQKSANPARPPAAALQAAEEDVILAERGLRATLESPEISIEAARPPEPLSALRSYDLGLQRHSLGDAAGAARHFRRALSLDPDFLAARQYLGFELYQLGRTYEALECLEAVLIRRPDLELAAWVRDCRDHLRLENAS